MKRLFFIGWVGLTALLTGVLAQAQTPLRLTLNDAIERGLQANLGVLLAGTRVEESEAARLRALTAARLPRLSAETYANLHSTDLRAQGFSMRGIPEMVGPMANYDFRISAQQNVVDRVSLHTLEAAERAIDADKMDERDVRDIVVQSVASQYLDAESSAARVRSAQSRVKDAETLARLARDRHDAGAATGVDVLRAEVQLANDRQSLLVYENRRQVALLGLARTIGLSPGTPIELAETLEFHPLVAQEISTLTDAALATRADYLELAAERKQLEAQQAASRARYFPKFTLGGNVGEIGRTFGQMRMTGAVQGQVDITLFDRDREGEAAVLAARVRRINQQMADMRRGIEQQLRQALLTLDSATQQVDVARQGESLAARELEMSSDRFQTGTANNVEVVTAQDELARAQENTIQAVSGHADAKYALARAMGDTAKNIAAFQQK
jgi:outer membrane protein TolC